MPSEGTAEVSADRVKACLFDLDGTLLYTLTSIAKAGNTVLRTFGWPEEAEDAYRYYCGDGADELVRRILSRAGDSDPGHFETGCRINREVLEANALLGVRPYDGLTESLWEIKRQGIRLGVCSNKPDEAVQKIIPAVFSPMLFDAVVGQMGGLRLKPAPDLPYALIEKLGVRADDCLYFGDSGTDMRTGKTAGMTTVGVLWGYRTEEELIENGADLLIKKPEEIADLCRRRHGHLF